MDRALAREIMGEVFSRQARARSGGPHSHIPPENRGVELTHSLDQLPEPSQGLFAVNGDAGRAQVWWMIEEHLVALVAWLPIDPESEASIKVVMFNLKSPEANVELNYGPLVNVGDGAGFRPRWTFKFGSGGGETTIETQVVTAPHAEIDRAEEFCRAVAARMGIPVAGAG